MNDADIAQLAGAIGAPNALNVGIAPVSIPGDGAIPIDRDGSYLLAKGSAAAITVAAPGTNNIGRKITITTITDFAHVVTFTGTTLMDGTAGLNTTWTATAVSGCSITFVAVSATRWAVLSFNLGTIAP
ncbi:MAG TPA: hypothetical protein VJ842_14310 [Pyrinomonadaceae bacterium]|nr:hypothetical protein [Pyrinomonadaceae bacterium]